MEQRLPRKKREIVISGLTLGTQLKDVINAYHSFGEIISGKINERYKNDEKVAVFVIQFRKGEDAESALKDKEFKVNGQEVKVGYARTMPRRPIMPFYSKTRLHVSGMGSMQEEELTKMLGKCSLIYPKKTDSKNPYVFAQYESEEDKRVAMEKLNGKNIDNEHTLKLSPAYAQRPRVPRRRSD